MTFQNHEKIVENYKNVICKTMKWTNIIKMEELS
jgi:hypothetical protein